ncbi:MAG: NAD(P)-binding domain-containing protein [Betaproteobacteria bacterium]|nr:NAD(P)-binding domain-containing protein [Betaproteobacteria bacterium]
MNAAVLGTGQVGIALAKGLAATGHTVVFGTRDPQGDNARKAVAAVPGSTALPYADAARGADFALLATPWAGTAQALELTGAAAVAGKLVIDATNPLEMGPTGPRLAIGHTTSAGETVQAALPQARVVKAFNIINCGLFWQPKFADGQPDMLIAGNDAAAKQQVAGLLRSFGWRAPIDVGGIDKARLLEPLAMLWIDYGVSRNHWTHGFSLLGQRSAS